MLLTKAVYGFNEFPSELLFEIFDYLSFIHVIQSFSGLNQKLNSVIQSYPSRIVLRSCNDENVFRFKELTSQ
ncbi:unnamed protein product, partial [Adineta ricciae]